MRSGTSLRKLEYSYKRIWLSNCLHKCLKESSIVSYSCQQAGKECRITMFCYNCLLDLSGCYRTNHRVKTSIREETCRIDVFFRHQKSFRRSILLFFFIKSYNTTLSHIPIASIKPLQQRHLHIHR